MRVTAALLAVLSLTSAAAAADLVIEEPPVAVAPAATWAGAYVGIHVGGAGGTETDNQSEIFDGGPAPADSFDLSGWLLGLHAGANLQMDSFVIGLEGVVDVTNIEGSADYEYYDGQDPYTGTLSFTSNWQASLNVRAGVAVDTLLFYGAAGVAIADGTLHDDSDEDGVYEDTATHVGWTVAAGAEYMFDPNWSGRVELRYSDYGDADYDLGWDDPVTASFTTTALTVGLSYRF
jgi:opacity protein-like surface antigen